MRVSILARCAIAAVLLAVIGCARASTQPAVGYLEGKASIGPLAPVEREGVPPATPSPAICMSRGLSVSTDGAEVASFAFSPDCTYRVELPPGGYVVRLREQPGVGGSKDLPKKIAIEAGKTVQLNLSIDTGIR